MNAAAWIRRGAGLPVMGRSAARPEPRAGHQMPPRKKEAAALRLRAISPEPLHEDRMSRSPWHRPAPEFVHRCPFSISNMWVESNAKAFLTGPLLSDAPWPVTVTLSRGEG